MALVVWKGLLLAVFILRDQLLKKIFNFIDIISCMVWIDFSKWGQIFQNTLEYAELLIEQGKNNIFIYFNCLILLLDIHLI